LYKKEKYKRTRKTLACGKYIDKTTKFGDLNLQSETIEYLWKVKGDGKDNAKKWKFASFLKGDSWTAWQTHYQDQKVFMVKANKL
jgi:hypothetical protein